MGKNTGPAIKTAGHKPKYPEEKKKITVPNPKSNKKKAGKTTAREGKTMKIENLTYKQFAMVRQAIIDEKEKIWQEKFAPLTKKCSIQEVREARERFNKTINQFTDYGICNVILKEIRRVEKEAQSALGMTDRREK